MYERITPEDVQRIIELDKEFQPLLEDAGIRCYRVAAKFNAEKMGYERGHCDEG